MEQMTFTLKASQSITKTVRVGNVASGDLEIMLQPSNHNSTNIKVSTSISHQNDLWKAILNKVFNDDMPAMAVTINDSGATPGVISLRLMQAFEQIEQTTETSEPLQSERASFIELSLNERINSILDAGTVREILNCEAFSYSNWLMDQDIIPQTNDGCIVAKGQFQGQDVVIAGVDPKFQGGAIGEISGAKMAATLELALKDALEGKKTPVILLLETGGVRLQEANLGLAAIADIHAGIVALRQHVPVIGVVAGTVGCFGGMSIAAGLCSKLIVTREARLGLNGPQVIEQEAGILEYDSRNRPFIWSYTGGEVRFKSGFVDFYVADKIQQVNDNIELALKTDPNELARCEKIDEYLNIFSTMDTNVQASPDYVAACFAKEIK